MTRLRDLQANPYLRQIEAKKANDQRVTVDEAKDLVDVWSKPMTPAQAAQLKRAVAAERSDFTTAAKDVVGAFMSQVVPRLITVHEPNSLVPKTSAKLSWAAPVQADGTPFPNLTGYKIFYGQSPTAMNKVAAVRDATATTYQLNNLGSGTWYFAMSSVGNEAGEESQLTNPVSKTIP